MKFTYYTIENYLTKEQIKSINNTIETKGRTFYAPSAEDKVKTSICHQIDYKLIESIKDIKATINWINREAFGFDVYNQLNTDQFIRNVYADINQGEYNWHFDADPHSFNYAIKLTTLINLSVDEYEGGEFFLWDGGAVVIKPFKKPGTLITFPSFYLHKVNPVTKGQRISGTFFMTGPKWK